MKTHMLAFEGCFSYSPLACFVQVRGEFDPSRGKSEGVVREGKALRRKVKLKRRSKRRSK